MKVTGGNLSSNLIAPGTRLDAAVGRADGRVAAPGQAEATAKDRGRLDGALKDATLQGQCGQVQFGAAAELQAATQGA